MTRTQKRIRRKNIAGALIIIGSIALYAAAILIQAHVI